MVGERTTEGWRIRLRSTGFGRYLSGAFLAFWLCGWAAGEAFAIWMLVRGAIALLTGTPPDSGGDLLQLGPAVLIGVFLLVWLTLWTIGGVAAISELLRLLWGEDRIDVGGGRLRVTWMRGPLRFHRTFERDAIRRVSLLGRGERLALETSGGRVELSALGTQPERREAAQTLRNQLGLQEISETSATLPKGWEQIITPEGERALVGDVRTRRTQARVASIATLALAGLTLLLARNAVHRLELLVPAFLLLAFTIALTAGTLWLARGRWEWRIGNGRLTLRKRYGSGVRDVFEARRLALESTTDSDGDPWYEVIALGDGDTSVASSTWSIGSKNRRTIARSMDDPAPMRDLARWLSRETGIELEDRTPPEARALQIAGLKSMLEGSGPFGRWAAKWVDRAAKR